MEAKELTVAQSKEAKIFRKIYVELMAFSVDMNAVLDLCVYQSGEAERSRQQEFEEKSIRDWMQNRDRISFQELHQFVVTATREAARQELLVLDSSAKELYHEIFECLLEEVSQQFYVRTTNKKAVELIDELSCERRGEQRIILRDIIRSQLQPENKE